ncbi:hypothetical protein [Winogradskyella sp.]|uniref:hypothetical protein n=1 Tax=Winogradskyella sp. TaxID=1883156 RepID=UPI003F6CFB08
MIIERLTALWALNECGLGGFMHAFSSPFTGIIVGGVSILLISLIAFYAKDIRTSLIKALSIVLLVKLSVSPHSPITAYLAVSFQAFLGIGLYSLFKVNPFTVILLGMLTFLESALQKLFTLTIIYGQSLWKAVDVYSEWINNKLSFISINLSTTNLLVIYISFYTISGLLVGILILKIIHLIQLVEVPKLNPMTITPGDVANKKNRSIIKSKQLLFWSITLVMILLPLLYFKKEYDGWETGLYLVSRSILIIGLWYLVLGPLLVKGLNKILSRRQSEYQSDLQQTLLLLPHLRSIVYYAWQDSSSYKGLNRMQHFLAKSIVFSVHFNPSKG